MKVLVTGGAAFIGSQVVERLLMRGHKVVVYDNLSTGQMGFLPPAGSSAWASIQFAQADLLDLPRLKEAMQGVDFVYHLAANADVRFGTNHPSRDLEQNTIGTFNVLEAMRSAGCRKIAFSSTGSIYGECKVIPTPEDSPFPVQTSLYGASKLAGEGLISAYCEGFGFQSWIFRFVSILGERYTHGHVFDFYKQLLANPNELKVLGDGRQKKSYLYVGDCMNAIETAIEKADDKVNIFNLGTEEFIQVTDSIGFICDCLGVKPKIQYGGGERGWIGDNPFIFLDTKKIRGLGWKPELTIKEGVFATLNFLRKNQAVLSRTEDRAIPAQPSSKAASEGASGSAFF
ncbi:MAG: NAD-dependent epimerase/dehydratase family protein [Bdellovibrio sp.]|nr:NAD-dependent epimerase/dehydratase family protein [Bdellovibrio sp.]